MDPKVDGDLVYKILVAVFGSGGLGAVLVAIWQRRRSQRRRLEIETPLKVIAAAAAGTVQMNVAEMGRMAAKILDLEERRDRQDERIELLEDQLREAEQRGREQELQIALLERELSKLRDRVDNGADGHPSDE